MTPAAAASSYRFRDLLEQRSYVRFWGSRLFATSGMQMLMVAVGWQMYGLTGSAWDLGLVGLYQFAPALLLALVAGHAADRFSRAHIVAACIALQAVVALTLVLGTYGGWVSRGLLLGLSVALGVARAFQMPAQQALTPMLVPPLMLPRAMAFSSAGSQAAIIGGPALGGLIFVAGAGAVYLTCFFLFVVGSVLMARLRYTRVRSAAAPVSAESLLAGVRFIWLEKPILGAISLDLFAVLLGGAVALLPIFARDILHTGPWGLGLLRAAPAVGALIMSVVLTRWPMERRVGARMLWAVALFGAATLVFGLSRNLLLSMAALAITGAADMVSVVVRQTLVQLETPDVMRGRVSAVNSVFIGASNQLGEFESGATAAILGPVGSVVAGGIGTIVIALLWFRVFPALAQRDSMASEQILQSGGG
jgi:MFS family permease